jgi:RND family efflux transporter MFP subunit
MLHPARLEQAALLVLLLLLTPTACQPNLDGQSSGTANADADAEPTDSESSTDAESGSEEGGDGRLTSSVSGGRNAVRETLVVVQPLTIGAIRDEVVVSGKIEARHLAQVFPKLSSLPITSVVVDEGDYVKVGDTLMTLYDTELRLAEQTSVISERQAKKDVDRENLRLAEQKKRILRAERQAQKAQDDLTRLEGLIGDGLINLQQVEDARLAAGTAADDLDLAHFSHDDGEMALALAELRANQAEVDSARARTDLSHTTVVAPIAGVISERNVNEGELSSMSAAAFMIVNVKGLLLNLRVAQDAFDKLAAGQRVEVRSVTQPGVQYQGTVRTVSPVLDRVTGTVHTIVDLDPAAGLVPGLFCKAHIITAARDEALLIDKRAVLYEDDQPVFFALDASGDSVTKVAFLAGTATPTSIEVLGHIDGRPIAADTRVVVVGQESLKDGARVRVGEAAY